MESLVVVRPMRWGATCLVAPHNMGKEIVTDIVQVLDKLVLYKKKCNC